MAPEAYNQDLFKLGMKSMLIFMKWNYETLVSIFIYLLDKYEGGDDNNDDCNWNDVMYLCKTVATYKK